MTDLSHGDVMQTSDPRSRSSSTDGTASVAVDQGKQVANEVKDQLGSLTRQAQSQVQEQSGAQKERAVKGLRQLGDQLERMGASPDAPDGIAGDLVRQAATRTRDAAAWLDQREPGELLDELRDLGRRHPGTFLLGALTAGVVAGRLTRGAVQPTIDEHTGTSSSTVDVRDLEQQPRRAG